MATANALAAIENGANRVEGAINGIGERAGNTALEEVALALAIRKDFYQCESNIVLNETKRTSELVSRLSGIPVPKNKAIVGDNAYAHESGIHQDGVLKNPETYEIITPTLVGVNQNSLPLGKLSGRHAFNAKLEELGYQLNDTDSKEAFKRFKALADKKKQITDKDLVALLADQYREETEKYKLADVQVQYSSNGYQGAIVSIINEENETQVASQIGSGSIQAIYNTIDELLQQDPELTEYEIQALTGGEDAQAEVRVTLRNKKSNDEFRGIGVDFDVLHASAKAYIQASNHLLTKLIEA